jgi:hypothetical protein
VKTIQQIKLVLPDIETMLANMQNHLEDGWGIEISKRRSGINQTISLYLNKHCVEFAILKNHYKKQTNRLKDQPQKIDVKTETNNFIEEKRQQLIESLTKTSDISLPVGNITWNI